MDDDLFDDRLAQSSPATASRGPHFETAVRTMIEDAEATVRPAPPRRRTAAGISIAAALALVIGGGGVAVASGLVSWPSGYEHPDGAYAFTAPSGRACEVRLVIGAPEPVEDSSAEGDRSDDTEAQREVQEEVARWLRAGALDEDLDLPAAKTEVAAIYAEQADVEMTVLIGADGWLTDAATVTGRPDADDAYAFAVDRAVVAAMTEHLREQGFSENTWTFGSDGGVKCAAE